MTYFQYNIFCLYHVSISSFILSRSVLLKLLKHVKLTVFDKKKIVTWRKKSIDDPRGESITADPEEDWGLNEDPITEDPKGNPINEKPKEGIITVTPIDNTINEDPQELQDPQWFLRRKLTLFWLFVNGLWQSSWWG